LLLPQGQSAQGYSLSTLHSLLLISALLYCSLLCNLLLLLLPQGYSLSTFHSLLPTSLLL
jgi:hypothetical protein